MSYKPAICSMSLGRCAANHSFPTKLRAAAAAGLSGIEIFYEDLAHHASTLPSGSHLEAAHEIRTLCDSLSLPIIGCGPFANPEGLLSPSARAAKREELYSWFDVCRVLGTDIIQIPSTFALPEQNTGDFNAIVDDLREIADLGAAEGFRFAYENLCWATYNDTWSAAWAIVAAVDRPNFGLCLDTFNIAGREYADPASPTGTVPNASVTFAASLKRMVATIDPAKIFYIQIVDAERLAEPLVQSHPFHVDGQKPRMSWSRNCRLFLGEQDRGGYLPVLDVLKALCDGLGYKGWVSYELFNRSLLSEDANVPSEHAERARKSWGWVCEQMGWENVITRESDVVREELKNGAVVEHKEDIRVEELFARL